jgi:hypothetical protein
MRLGQDVLCDLDAALAREWLLTNGLGGTASGTASGAHTRRTHALLIAAGPRGRLAVALLKLDERLHAGAESVELGCNLYAAGTPGAEGVTGGDAGPGHQARPAGHLSLEEFRADPWPTWRWRAAGVTLEKSVFLVHGHNAVAVAYRHLDGPSARLIVSPLIATRDPHGLQRESEELRGAAQAVPGRVRFETGPGWPALTLWHSGAFMPARVWQRGLIHPADPRPAAGRPAGRGKSRRIPEQASEDAFVPGYLECALPVGGAFHVVAAIEDDLFRALAVEGRLGAPPPRTLAECVELLARGERDRAARWRRTALVGADFTARQAATAHGGPGEALARRSAPLVEPGDPWVPRLAQALADGLVQRGERTTLLASLPAGDERGEDTLRAVPALITLRAFEPAREVLRGYVEYLNEGLAPESFDPADGRPRYGDPAPALWLVHAAGLLARRSEDLDLVRSTIYPAVESIMQSYRAGTRGGIHVRATGLLSAGEGEAACCRTDVNALWFHALVAAAQLARLTGRKESGAFYLAWAREHQTRMLAGMWDGGRGCFYEALAADGPRPGLSPSQLFAVSLSPPLLPPEQAARLVETVERELFTPLGLRASAGADTASPAWLGAFITAHLRVHQRSAESQARARGWLETLHQQLDERTAAHVPEVLPAPRRGDAAARRAALAAATAPPAPASVLAAAELLRVWIEEVDRTEAPAGVA